MLQLCFVGGDFMACLVGGSHLDCEEVFVFSIASREDVFEFMVLEGLVEEVIELGDEDEGHKAH